MVEADVHSVVVLTAHDASAGAGGRSWGANAEVRVTRALEGDARARAVGMRRGVWSLDSWNHSSTPPILSGRGNVVEDDGGGGLFVVVFGLFLDGFIGGLDDDFRFRIRIRVRFRCFR